MPYKDKNKAKAYRKEYYKKYYIRKRDYIINKTNNYYKENKEIINERRKEHDKEYRRLNKAILKERYKQWSKNNKEYVRIRRLKYCDSSGHSKSERWRYTKQGQTWKYQIYKNANYTCQKCGTTHCKLNAHHIKFAKDYPSLRYDLNNGICLCESCHKKIYYS